jgi:flagellar biosynthesis/type III secretory pathway protein FliH
MSWSSPRLRDDWGGRLVKARAVVLLPEAAAPPPRGEAGGDGAARVDAEEALQAALAEAAAARARAEEEGRREGLRQGERQGYVEGLRRGAEEGRAVVEEALAEARELRSGAARELSRLACEIASHLLGVAVRFDPDLVEERVLHILSESQPLGILEVAVHPHDLKAARAAKKRWLAELAGDVEVAVVPDPDLAEGACRVRTRAGDVEWDWPERLAEIDRAMEEVARRHGLDG